MNSPSDSASTIVRLHQPDPSNQTSPSTSQRPAPYATTDADSVCVIRWIGLWSCSTHKQFCETEFESSEYQTDRRIAAVPIDVTKNSLQIFRESAGCWRLIRQEMTEVSLGSSAVSGFLLRIWFGGRCWFCRLVLFGYHGFVTSTVGHGTCSISQKQGIESLE